MFGNDSNDMKNGQEYKYYAFISYKSTNEKWAKWLQEKLESYRLPTTLCNKNKDLPKQIRPCFRYHTDIQPNELVAELETKLRQSRYLIVVCSPCSARSAWIGTEIDIFVRLGRRANIIPFIIEGIPYSEDAETECYHSVIRQYFPHTDNPQTDKELLGANIHEEGRGSKRYKRERAAIQIVSRMFNVSFDELWKRQRRKRIHKLISLGIAIMIFAASLIYVWFQGKPTNVAFSLQEITIENSYLPPLRNAIITMDLGNEVKKCNITSISDTAMFTNVPSECIGKLVHIVMECNYFQKIDTVIKLEKRQKLNVKRNEHIFGGINIALWNVKNETILHNQNVYIDGIEIRSDSNGVLRYSMPLSKQRQKYMLRTPLSERIDTIYMPCGKNDVLWIK